MRCVNVRYAACQPSGGVFGKKKNMAAWAGHGKLTESSLWLDSNRYITGPGER